MRIAQRQQTGLPNAPKRKNIPVEFLENQNKKNNEGRRPSKIVKFDSNTNQNNNAHRDRYEDGRTKVSRQVNQEDAIKTGGGWIPDY